MAADRNSISIFYNNAVKQKRPFYRCFRLSTDGSVDFSHRCFFKIMNFSNCFRLYLQVNLISGNENHKWTDFFRFAFFIPSSFFIASKSGLFMDFLNFKKLLKKDSVMQSIFINAAMRRIYNPVKHLRQSFFQLLKSATYFC